MKNDNIMKTKVLCVFWIDFIELIVRIKRCINAKK